MASFFPDFCYSRGKPFPFSIGERGFLPLAASPLFSRRMTRAIPLFLFPA